MTAQSFPAGAYILVQVDREKQTNMVVSGSDRSSAMQSKVVYQGRNWLDQVIREGHFEEGIFELRPLQTKRASHVTCRKSRNANHNKPGRSSMCMRNRRKVRMTGEEQRKRVVKREEAGAR